jgi:putative hemolysin
VNLPGSLSIFSSLLPGLPLVISLTIVTSFHVVLGEQVPKVAVLRAPERFVLLAAPAMQGFIKIFWWFISLLDWATRATLKFFGLSEYNYIHSTVITADELKQIVSGSEIEGAIEPPEREMLTAVIEFGALVVRQVMVPRIDIIAVEATASLPEALQVAAGHGLTKLPVYEENLDQVVGVLHVKDLLPLLQDGDFQTRTTRELARDALFVPETVSVNSLLLLMRDKRQHLAITLDEFGGTAGLVTLEDLLKEIIGDVRDEFDESQPDIQILPDGSALLDGMAAIEDVNEKFGLTLYDPNYDTIAGFVLGRLGRIPQTGDLVDESDQNVRLKVDQMERLRIARIHLSRL